MATERPSHDQVTEATASAEASMRPQSVPVNVYETPAALVVLAPLPAVTAKDVTIEVSPGSLRFWARLRSAGPRDFLVHEWEYGCYEREIELPDGFGRGRGHSDQRSAGHPGFARRQHRTAKHTADYRVVASCDLAPSVCQKNRNRHAIWGGFLGPLDTPCRYSEC